MSSKNILVLGGGLAGSYFAVESLRAGHRVTLLDQPRPDTPSRVAAGLFNILTGRVASLTWQARTLLDHLDDFFRQPDLGDLRRHLHRLPIYRPYKTVAERNEWYIRTHSPEFDGLLRHQSRPIRPEHYHNPLGGIDILPCGWLDTRTFLRELRSHLATHPAFQYHETTWDHRQIQPGTGQFRGDTLRDTFDEIVCCEGPALKDNPWFNWIDLRPLKGQVIEIEAPDLPEDLVLLRKVFLVPRGQGRFVVGSTYEKKFSHSGPTLEGVRSLEEYTGQAIQVPFHTLESRAGIRPTTPNRRPVMGRHPDHPRLLVLNGFGAKGVLQGPWCVRQFRRWLDGNAPLPVRDVRLDRFDHP